MSLALTLRLRTLWALVVAALYAAVGLGGLAFAVHALGDPRLGPGAATFGGLPPLLVAGVMVPLHLALPWLPARPRTWTLTLVLLLLSAVGSCPPLAIPVLVGWLGSPARALHGR
ncbi:hypothetical protein L6R53_21770 [Myxococcota bacterium]|nr:hypothetical protein [Myxococcota bacterium]